MILLLFFVIGVLIGLIVKTELRIEKPLNLTLIVLVFAMGAQAGSIKVNGMRSLVVSLLLMVGAVAFSMIFAYLFIKAIGGNR